MGWRAAFYALGVPGLLTALIVWLTLREPPRGLAEGSTSFTAAPSFKVVFQTLWANRSFRHVLLGYVVISFSMNAVANFVLPFYLRSFGLPLAVAGAAFGAVSFSSNGLGMLVGGFGFDRLSRRDTRWPLWGPAGMMILAAPLYLSAFASTQVWVSMTFIWFANLTLATHTAPTMATLQSLLGPRMRAMSTAIVFLAANLLGAGLGPTMLGMASDFFAGHAFAAGDFLASCPGGGRWRVPKPPWTRPAERRRRRAAPGIDVRAGVLPVGGGALRARGENPEAGSLLAAWRVSPTLMQGSGMGTPANFDHVDAVIKYPERAAEGGRIWVTRTSASSWRITGCASAMPGS